MYSSSLPSRRGKRNSYPKGLLASNLPLFARDDPEILALKVAPRQETSLPRRGSELAKNTGGMVGRKLLTVPVMRPAVPIGGPFRARSHKLTPGAGTARSAAHPFPRWHFPGQDAKNILSTDH